MDETTVLDALIKVKTGTPETFDQVRRMFASNISRLSFRVLACRNAANGLVQFRTPVPGVYHHTLSVNLPERLQQIRYKVLNRFHLLQARIVCYSFTDGSIAPGKLSQFKIFTDLS